MKNAETGKQKKMLDKLKWNGLAELEGEKQTICDEKVSSRHTVPIFNFF